MQKDLFNDITKKTYSNLRIPYMGSKNKISHDLMYKMLEYKPNAKYFVDCCGGGASLSFLAIQMGLKVHYNDLQTDLVNFVEYIINRVKNNEKSKYGLFPEEFYNFVDRETFNKHKNESTIYGQFIRICYSFGNNQRSYAFCKDIEKQKQLAHNIVMFQCEKSLKEFNEIFNVNFTLSNKKTWNERRFDYMQNFSREQRLKKEEVLVHLQHLENLERITHLERIQNITFSNLSYKDIIINTPPEETIVYLDIPYRNTEKYVAGKDFNYEELDNWFKNHNYTCFLSEYNAPHKCIFEIKKAKLLNNTNLTERQYAIEKLYWNEK